MVDGLDSAMAAPTSSLCTAALRRSILWRRDHGKLGGWAMKALVLAGGTGSRLRPLTYTSAKQLIPVGNKPILFYALESIAAAGIVDVVVVVGDTADEVMTAVGDGVDFGIRVTYLRQEQPLGLAHAVQLAEEYLGKDDFLMFLGDNLLRDGVGEFVRDFSAQVDAAEVMKDGHSRPLSASILLSRVEEPQYFGVAELENGRVARLVEKPAQPRSHFALVGAYLFRPAIFAAVRAIQPSLRGELEITDAIQWLLDHGHDVAWREVSGWWKDTGKPEDVLDANRLVLDGMVSGRSGAMPDRGHAENLAIGAGGISPKSPLQPMRDAERRPSLASSRVFGRAFVHPTAQLIRSVIRGPVVIGEGARIEDAYVGPYTSIQGGVTVRRTEIENSIVLAGSIVEDISRLDGCLIGKRAKITAASARPKGVRLIVGDDSRCEL